MVKMIMHGCNGAMGQVITKLASEDNDAEIVAGIDCADNRENPYPVFTSCDACDVDADVIVDFSVAQAVDGVLAYALKRKMPLVLCTTGLSDKQLEDVKAASSQIPVLRSANMSLGVNTVFKLAAAAAKIGIQAVRGGTIVGEHEVFYCGQDEVIEIKHTAYSKAIFGKGAIQAARFLKDQKPGMYQMSDVIG